MPDIIHFVQNFAPHPLHVLYPLLWPSFLPQVHVYPLIALHLGQGWTLISSLTSPIQVFLLRLLHMSMLYNWPSFISLPQVRQ